MAQPTIVLSARFDDTGRRRVLEVAAAQCVVRQEQEQWVLRMSPETSRRPQHGPELLRAVADVVAVAGARTAGYLTLTYADGGTGAYPPHRWPIFEIALEDADARPAQAYRGRHARR